jgi:hypothetical protein
MNTDIIGTRFFHLGWHFNIEKKKRKYQLTSYKNLHTNLLPYNTLTALKTGRYLNTCQGRTLLLRDGEWRNDVYCVLMIGSVLGHEYCDIVGGLSRAWECKKLKQELRRPLGSQIHFTSRVNAFLEFMLKVIFKVTLEQTTKAHRGCRGIDLIFIYPWHIDGVGGQRHVPAALLPGRRTGAHCNVRVTFW